MSAYAIAFVCGDNVEDLKIHTVFTGTMEIDGNKIAVATLMDSPTAEHNFTVLNGTEDDALQKAIKFLEKLYPDCKQVKTKIG